MIRVEWIRQTRRIRTWACLALLAAVPIIITVSSYLDPPRERRFDLNLFTVLTSSGINVGVISLVVMGQFFLVVVIAAFAGESVAGEATWGTLRYLLIRPVGRPKLIVAKIAIAALLALASTVLITLVSLLIGSLFFGWRDALLVGQSRILPLELLDPWEGVGRLVVASGYVWICMLFVVAVGMFLSTLTDSTAAAVVGTIVIVV